ncbi:MAG: LuxR C-terminal-related transcriptional regulator [Bacteroidales bacterium]|nr:LuxR C-terminal-related transcriptional regulator [Bacteroidales bacterium]
MAKNNHQNTDLAFSLDTLFSEQFISTEETLDESPEKYLGIAAMYASVEACISVLSDLKTRRSFIFYGQLGEDLGIADEGTTHTLDTIWEEEILCRISETDLARKEMEEMKFFSFIRNRQEDGHRFYMSSSFPMTDSEGKRHSVRHRIFYFHSGKTVRYALCLYNASSAILAESSIVNSRTGEEIPLYRIDSSKMLSDREKEVLSLVSKGLSSKEIADRLCISVFTVSRHRQNIIATMNVKNSSQACQLAHQMGLI